MKISAILLEKSLPGKNLMSHNCDSLTAVEIACDAELNLKNKQEKINFPFKTVRDLLRNLDKEWNLSQDWILLARKLKNELLSESYETYLIHGDLHRENILSHANSWVVIDPKGYIGSLYSEVWPFIHDPEIEYLL